MPSIIQTAKAVDEAIRIGSVGSPSLRAKLEAQRNIIGRMFCVQSGIASHKNIREIYLRILIEVLKVGLIEAAQLVDFTEAREDADRKMDQKHDQNRTGSDKQYRENNLTGTMRQCSFREWDRHRVGDDESDSESVSKSRANSYLYATDSSASKSASGEEGVSENIVESGMSQLGQGTTQGVRNSSSVSHIKPKGDGAEADTPPTAAVGEDTPSCAGGVFREDWISVSGILQFIDCLLGNGGILEFITGKNGGYDAENAKDSAGFSTAGLPSGIAGCISNPQCSVQLTDDLCTETGASGWAARVAALPETFSNSYSGNYVMELTIGFSALGTGIGLSVRFNLAAGESISQSAKIDQGYNFASTQELYCSDMGSISGERARAESYGQTVAQNKNDRHRRSERASEAGSTLEATSVGTMRFSGKSSSGNDRSLVRSGNGQTSRVSLVEDRSTAILADISGMRMQSVTEYRHQVTKMIHDLLKKTQEELEQLHINTGRKQGIIATTVDKQFTCSTPMGKLRSIYVRPTIRGKHPLLSSKCDF